MPTVTIHFDIVVPRSTPEDAEVFLIGSDPSMTARDPRGIAARRIGERLFRATVTPVVGGEVRFVITRGSRATVEVTRWGAPRAHRRRRFTRTTTIQITVAEWADAVRRGRAAAGRDDEHDVPSQALGGARRVVVHLPPGYDGGTEAHALLVAHDGRDLRDAAAAFSGVGWAVEQAIDRLVARGRIEPVVVAAVSSDPARPREVDPEAPEGLRYRRFVVDELIPYLGARYRLHGERTGVAGAHAGAIVAIDLAERHREIFTRVGIVSPSLLAPDAVADRLERSPLPPAGRRAWMDVGTSPGGGDRAPGFWRLREALVRAGWRDELAFALVGGRAHPERDWVRRLPRVLEHLYPPRHG